MKLAVISDIHSNHAALKSALDFVGRIRPEGIIFLGDYVTDCPYPQKTMELLYSCRESYPCWFLRGNREEYLLNHRENSGDEWCPSSASGSLLYTYENLTDADLDFFESMSLCVDIALEGCLVITACHSTLTSGWRDVFNDEKHIADCLNEISGDLLVMGHAHRSREYAFGGRKALFCPSIGLPKYEENALTILELCDGIWQCSRESITYNSNELLREFDESGLTDAGKIWTLGVKKFIESGGLRNYSVDCVKLGWNIASLDGFSGETLPEKYWIAAAREIGIIS